MAGIVGPDPSNSEASGQQFATNPIPGAGLVPVSNGDGTFTWTSPGSLSVGAIDGVVVSGTPSAGQVITAETPTTAHWATPS